MKFTGGFVVGFVVAMVVDFFIYDAFILSRCVVWG